VCVRYSGNMFENSHYFCNSEITHFTFIQGSTKVTCNKACCTHFVLSAHRHILHPPPQPDASAAPLKSVEMCRKQIHRLTETLDQCYLAQLWPIKKLQELYPQPYVCSDIIHYYINYPCSIPSVATLDFQRMREIIKCTIT